MSLSEISIRNPVFAWMLMIALIFFGALSFREMGVSQLPDVDFPVVNISLRWEGASPEVMELDVVDQVESAVMGVEGVTRLSSTAKRGSADVTVEFDLSKNIDVAVNEIQTKLSQAQRRLPKDLDPPIVTKSNPEDRPIMWLSVTADNLPLKDLMRYVRDKIKDQFQTLPGVSEIFLGGYVEPNLRVWVSQKDLSSYYLSVNDVLNAIGGEHGEPPAGSLSNEKQEFNIRTMGEAKTAEEFARLPINRRGGGPNFVPIRLGEVATVEEGLADVTRLSRVMGKPSVGLGIRKQRGANAVATAKMVKAKMESLKATLPPGMEIGINFDSTRFIEESVEELLFTLSMAALLTSLVCWMFLGSWSATINVIMSIPTSTIGAFIVLNIMGFTLNTFTLLALSLAIGIVVDDAIMVLENIFRHFEEGKDKVWASREGAREITFAALTATVAIVAIFLPVAFMKGIIGKYFYQFGVTLSVAVVISLLEALTLTPMRCSQLMTKQNRSSWLGLLMDRSFHFLEGSYRKAIPLIFRFRWPTLILSLLFFGGTYSLVTLLKKEFVPPQDTGSLMVRVKTADGSSLAFTDEKVKEVEKYFLGRSEVKRYFTAIGGFGGDEASTAMFFITLKDFKDRPKGPAGKPLKQQELIPLFRGDLNKLEGVKVFIQDPSLGGFTSAGRGFPIEFTIQGPQWEKLIGYSKTMMEEMEKTGTMADVNSDYRGEIQELHVVPRRDKLSLHGVSIEEIGTTVRALLAGVVVGKFSQGGRRFDIRVKLRENELGKWDDIKKIRVRNNRGELIPLSSLVDVELTSGPLAITRQNRERAVSVYANMAPGASQAVVLDTIRTLAQKILPADYTLVESGSSKTFKESFSSLVFALVLGLIVSYMVLASQFNSLLHPLTVLVALPFSISGAFISLYLGNQSLNIYSMIGLILLMGIVKKNSILLVDFTNQLRAKGMDKRSAFQEAGPKRLRPILMTSLATVVGALPAAFSIGPGAESLIPMALAIIGGVLVSTLLTLFVVPCFYDLLSFGKEDRPNSESAGPLMAMENLTRPTGTGEGR